MQDVLENVSEVLLKMLRGDWNHGDLRGERLSVGQCWGRFVVNLLMRGGLLVDGREFCLLR